MRELLPLLFLAACAASPQAPEPDAAARALHAEQRADWLTAGELWQRLHDQAQRRDPVAARGLARALEAQGDLVGAARVLRSTQSQDALLHLQLGDYCSRLGDPREAERQWALACAGDPSSIEARRRLSALRVGQGRHAEALPALREALALAPRDPALWADFARAALAAGEWIEARQAHLALAGLRPLDLDEALVAARLLIEARAAQHYASAAGWLETALASDPQRAEGWRLLAALCDARGDEAGALDALRSALEADPGDVVSLLRLGEARAALGEWQRVEALARHARALGAQALVARFEALLAARPAEALETGDDGLSPCR